MIFSKNLKAHKKSNDSYDSSVFARTKNLWFSTKNLWFIFDDQKPKTKNLWFSSFSVFGQKVSNYLFGQKPFGFPTTSEIDTRRIVSKHLQLPACAEGRPAPAFSSGRTNFGSLDWSIDALSGLAFTCGALALDKEFVRLRPCWERPPAARQTTRTPEVNPHARERTWPRRNACRDACGAIPVRTKRQTLPLNYSLSFPKKSSPRL